MVTIRLVLVMESDLPGFYVAGFCPHCAARDLYRRAHRQHPRRLPGIRPDSGFNPGRNCHPRTDRTPACSLPLIRPGLRDRRSTDAHAGGALLRHPPGHARANHTHVDRPAGHGCFPVDVA